MWQLCLLPAKQRSEESRVACAAASLAEIFRVTLTPAINIGAGVASCNGNGNRNSNQTPREPYAVREFHCDKAADISGYERSGLRYDSKPARL
ncbi:hypothetical protein MRB53_008547 [Persea americana]|uniref:Uncharacterized protein n=1 Tax=Persea americana TaxID=3435 RepID=A0ACC2MN71_PERAE|nr:hypothetical protein MRB53_008547 [Persea americana]